MTLLPVPLIVVLVAMIIAAMTDLRQFKIHNLLTLPLLVSGLVYHAVVGGPAEFLGSALGALFGFGILLLLYLVGGMGGGDLKLMAGVGAWLGVPLTFLVFIAAALATGLYSLVVIIGSGRLRETWVNLQIMCHRVAAVGKHLVAEDRVENAVQRDDRRTRVVPFGAMMGIGLVVLLAIARLRPSP